MRDDERMTYIGSTRSSEKRASPIRGEFAARSWPSLALGLVFGASTCHGDVRGSVLTSTSCNGNIVSNVDVGLSRSGVSGAFRSAIGNQAPTPAVVNHFECQMVTADGSSSAIANWNPIPISSPAHVDPPHGGYG